MNTPATASQMLASARKEIDRIDDNILTLLAERAQVVEHVKAAKKSLDIQLPLRPAREAEVLRRLLAQGARLGVNPELVVRLWPAIISDASLRQAEVTIHVAAHVSRSPALRQLVRDYYPLMQIAEESDDAAAVAAAHRNVTGVAVVQTTGSWLQAMNSGAARVMAALPFLSHADAPELLVIGQCQAQGSASDETLISTMGGLPRDFALQIKWQTSQGDHTITALPGFLSEREPPLHALIRVNSRLALKVIGRYPSPTKSKS